MHFCYFDRTRQQQPPFTQVLTVHHYTSLQLLHKNNQSNLAALHKGLKMLFLHMHTHTHPSSSLYCTIKLRFIPIKAQNASRLNSVISPPEVQHIIYCHAYIQFVIIYLHHFQCVEKTKSKIFHVYTIKGYWGEEVQLHPFLTTVSEGSEREVNFMPMLLYPQRKKPAQRIGAWVCPTDRPDILHSTCYILHIFTCSVFTNYATEHHNIHTATPTCKNPFLVHCECFSTWIYSDERTF